jgi:hypothetical protein
LHLFQLKDNSKRVIMVRPFSSFLRRSVVILLKIVEYSSDGE